MVHVPDTAVVGNIFELNRLYRWVRMLEELDTIVAAFPSDLLDERRRLLNRIIFTQCATLSAAGLAAEVDRVIDRYHRSQSACVPLESLQR